MHTIEPHKHTGPLAGFMPDYEGITIIECNRCTCVLSGETKADAVNAWNTRKPIQQDAAEVKEPKIDWKAAVMRTFLGGRA